MQHARIIPLALLACTMVWAEPATNRPVQEDAPPRSAETEAAKRRNELKAVLRSRGNEEGRGKVSMDVMQRQQLRRQLREQSSQ